MLVSLVRCCRHKETRSGEKQTRGNDSSLKGLRIRHPSAAVYEVCTFNSEVGRFVLGIGN